MGIVILIVAKIAFILSIISLKRTNKLAKTDFILSHRPFVWAENSEYKDKNHMMNSINEVIIKVLNSPANIIREFYSYYTIDDQGNKTIVEESEYGNIIRYPENNKPYLIVSSEVSESIFQNLSSDQELERFIEIDYSWLSTDKRYIYKSNCRFDKNKNIWKSINQVAN